MVESKFGKLVYVRPMRVVAPDHLVVDVREIEKRKIGH